MLHGHLRPEQLVGSVHRKKFDQLLLLKCEHLKLTDRGNLKTICANDFCAALTYQRSVRFNKSQAEQSFDASGATVYDDSGSCNFSSLTCGS